MSGARSIPMRMSRTTRSTRSPTILLLDRMSMLVTEYAAVEHTLDRRYASHRPVVEETTPDLYDIAIGLLAQQG